MEDPQTSGRLDLIAVIIIAVAICALMVFSEYGVCGLAGRGC